MNKIELPDFDAMVELAKEVGRNKAELAVCKNELAYLLGEITRKVTTDSTFWLDGSPPSNAHIRDTYHQLGVDESTHRELKTLRARIAELEGELHTNKTLMSVYQDMIGVWRTESANQRGTFLE